mgnify:CR=1 FL=1
MWLHIGYERERFLAANCNYSFSEKLCNLFYVYVYVYV